MTPLPSHLFHLDLPLGPLRLETARGYRDSSVEGGLGPFIERWADAAAQSAADEGQRQALLTLRALFRGYAAASVAQRREWVATAEETVRALTHACPARARRAASRRPVDLDSGVAVIRGISDRRVELLARLDIRTVGDLLRHYPARHEDRRNVVPLAQVTPRQAAVVTVEVTGPGETVRRGGQQITRVPVADRSAEGVLTWFGQPYRAGQFPVGTKLVLYCINTLYMLYWRHALGSDAGSANGRRPRDVGVLGQSLVD